MLCTDNGGAADDAESTQGSTPSGHERYTEYGLSDIRAKQRAFERSDEGKGTATAMKSANGIQRKGYQDALPVPPA
ncbi:hypothetical protein VTO73DRAFT_13024 [Trametes versicolor]